MWSDYALTVIDAVARTGSFSQAARELHRVPSAISYTVRQVEAWLAVPLFSRGHRDVELTEAGAHFISQGRLIQKQMQTTRYRCQQLAKGFRGKLHLAVDSIVRPSRIRQLIIDFYQHFPDIELHVKTEVFNGVWDALAAGRAEIIIGATQAIPVAGRFSCRDMGALTWCCVVGRQHPLLLATQTENQRLQDYPSLMLEDTAQNLPARTTWLLDNQARRVVPDWQTALDCAIKNLGIAMLPAHLARPQIAAGKLVELSLPEPLPASPCCVSWDEQRSSPALHWLLDYLGDSQTLNSEWLS